jgi:hypothetical protein
MVGNQHPDAALAELIDDGLNVEDGNRIDAGKGLVEQHEMRRGDQGAANFDAAPFAAGERVGAVFGQVRDAELLEQASQALGAFFVGERQGLEDGKQVVTVIQNGQQTEREVEIGLQNATYAEVKSGLEVGEIVVTE